MITATQPKRAAIRRSVVRRKSFLSHVMQVLHVVDICYHHWHDAKVMVAMEGMSLSKLFKEEVFGQEFRQHVYRHGGPSMHQRLLDTAQRRAADLVNAGLPPELMEDVQIIYYIRLADEMMKWPYTEDRTVPCVDVERFAICVTESPQGPILHVLTV